MRRNCGFSWANRLLHHIGGLAERATKQPFKAKVGSVSVEFKETVITKNPKTLEDAVDAAAEVAENLIPYGIPICGRPSSCANPFTGAWVDVTGFAPGTVVIDPYTDKFFRVPEPRI